MKEWLDEEYLNNALKQKLNHRQKAKTVKELTNSVSSIMRSMQANKESIKNLFMHDILPHDIKAEDDSVRFTLIIINNYNLFSYIVTLSALIDCIFMDLLN